MPKSLAGIFATVLIAFITSSAFTIKHKNATILNGEWYVLKSNQNFSLSSFTGLNGPINDIYVYEESFINGGGYAQKFSQEDVDEVYCGQEEPVEFVCAVEMSAADMDVSGDIDEWELNEYVLNCQKLHGISFKDAD